MLLFTVYRPQFLLDRLGRYLKLFVSTVIPFYHTFAFTVPPSKFFIGAKPQKRSQKLIVHLVARARLTTGVAIAAYIILWTKRQHVETLGFLGAYDKKSLSVAQPSIQLYIRTIVCNCGVPANAGFALHRPAFLSVIDVPGINIQYHVGRQCLPGTIVTGSSSAWRQMLSPQSPTYDMPSHNRQHPFFPNHLDM